MKRLIMVTATLAVLGACGDGNPFNTDPDAVGGGGGDDTSGIPDAIAGDLDAFTYNPATDTLSITGVFLDDEPATTLEYIRTPSLDRPGYVAYTAQEDPLDRHVTAYAQSISAVTGTIAVTGGQFTFYNGGVAYTRNGAFDPQDVTPDTGLVSYAGNYIGIINSGGRGPEILPVAPGTPADITPVQANRVTGRIFINADFIDNTVNGTIFERQIDPAAGGAPIPVETINMRPTDITADGTFTGTIEIAPGGARTDVGTYNGIFGGPNSDAVAGGIRAEEHIGTDSEEYGLFVLGRCGTAVGTDPLCPQVDQ